MLLSPWIRRLLGGLWLSVELTLPSAGLHAQDPAGLAQEALLATNAARFAAMVREDLPGLDTLLAPELTYIHSDGQLESKAEFLATGLSRMRVKVGPELLQFSIRFTALYRRASKRWVLVAWQATRLPK